MCEAQEVRSLWASLSYIRSGEPPLPPDDRVPGSPAMTHEVAGVWAHLVDISLKMTPTEAGNTLSLGEEFGTLCCKLVRGM